MKSSVLFIGGGIMSAAAAAALARAGHPVTVLEKGEPACGASGANLGQLSLFDRTEPWHYALAMESFGIFSGLADELEYAPSGGVVVLQNEEQYRGAIPVAEALRALGEPAQLILGPEVRRVEPCLDHTRIYGVLYCPNEGKLNPLRTTLYYCRQAQAAGVRFFPHTAVTGFETRGGTVTAVRTDRGEVHADVVIAAAGAWTGELCAKLGLSLPMGFHRATAFVSQPVPPCINGPIVGGELFLAHRDMSLRRHIGLGGVQTAQGSVIIAQATETAPLGSRSVSLPGLCLTARTFLDHFPTLGELQIVRAWACVTPYTHDGLPLFGFTREYPNLFVLSGFKGAFSVAPAVARILVRALDEGYVWENDSFSPSRAPHEPTKE